ncbi:MAG: hypothetical protein CMH52_00860 [Myxococcales bacterium]|nr:hypothetical protein [Myxococcales bacterium]
MNGGVKAVFVVFGLFGFFFIAVAGPLLGDAGNDSVQLVLGYDDEKRVENRKIREDPGYGASGDLRIARDCCTQCNADWNHHEDRCELLNQAMSKCYVNACSK